MSGDGGVLVVHMEDLNRLRWYVGLTMSASHVPFEGCRGLAGSGVQDLWGLRMAC